MFKGESMSKQTCILCRKPLNNGIMINGRGICKCCEEKLISVQIDTDFYQYYKECIKKTMTKYMLREVENRCPNYHL